MNRNDQCTRRQALTAGAALAPISILPRHGLGGPGQKAPSETLNRADVGIGAVREVHVGSDRPTHKDKLPLYWTQGVERPRGKPPVPAIALVNPPYRRGWSL